MIALKVLLAHNEYAEYSGEEAVVEDMCRLLSEQGHDVIQHTRSSAEIAQMRAGEIRAFFSGIYSCSSKNNFRRLLTKHRPDIVHIHNLFPLISPSILTQCRAVGLPVVMTVHNYRLVCPNGLHLARQEICEKCAGGREWWCVLRNCEGSFFKSLGYAIRNYVARKQRLYLDNVTMYAALTEFQRQRLIRDGFPAERIVVIPNMAHSPPQPTPCELGDYVGFVGRISPEKGIPSLLAAARQCRTIPFRAAGGTGRMPELPAQAPANFEFLGHLNRENLSLFYSSSRFNVLCSTCFEGFPQTLVEAMLHGKPVVCSRIGGLTEILEDGVTGLLFEPGNANDLRKKIEYLWDRPSICQEMGQTARRKALREYSAESYYQRLMAMYARALTLGPGGPRLHSCSYHSYQRSVNQ